MGNNNQILTAGVATKTAAHGPAGGGGKLCSQTARTDRH